MNRGSPEIPLKNQSITGLYRDIAQAFDSPADHFQCNPGSNRALVGMQFSALRERAESAEAGDPCPARPGWSRRIRCGSLRASASGLVELEILIAGG